MIGRHGSAGRPRPLGLALAGALGAGAALLVACGSNASSPALIPPANAGSLKGDFDAVAAAVNAGSCSQRLKTALIATRKDLAALPTSLDAQLMGQLQRGVNALSDRAHTDCKQQTTSTTPTTPTQTNTTPTNTTTTPTDTTTNTTPTNTTTNTTPTNTDTNTTPPTTPTGTDTTPTAPPTGGGTPAPQGQVSRGAGGLGGAGGTLGNGGGGN